MIKKLLLLFIFYTCLCPAQAKAQFVISSENSCSGNDIYPFFFSESGLRDYTVKVSEHPVLADITIKIVDEPEMADLIISDNLPHTDMRVCKAVSAFGNISIKVGEYVAIPDITIRLSENPIMPDYKMFVYSKTFTHEEAAALFAVIWKQNHQR